MKIYIVDGTPVLDGTPKELAQYQHMVQQLAVYDAYQKLLKAIAEGKPPGSGHPRKRKERMRAMNNHDSPPRPVIALDFDGTICQNAYPDIGEPNWHVIEKAKQCQEQGAYLILWTCRGGQMLEKAVAACTEWGLTFDAINENLPEWREAYGTDPRKIGATEYWDDRSVIADGTCVLRSSRCAADHAEWEARKCSEQS